MQKGQRHTIESRRKISRVRKGIKFSDEHKAELSRSVSRFWRKIRKLQAAHAGGPA